jgi:hypothetical protein
MIGIARARFGEGDHADADDMYMLGHNTSFVVIKVFNESRFGKPDFRTRVSIY